MSTAVFVLLFAAVAQDTERLSVDSLGAEADGSSFVTQHPATSGGDAALVVFTSTATNLVAKDLNGMSDVFLRDLAKGTVTRIVFDLNGQETDGDASAASITSDGGFVVFTSDATDLVKNDNNGLDDIFVLDRTTGVIERASIADDESEADGSSSDGAISLDGRYVGFRSRATNLAGSDTAGHIDVFLRDRLNGTTTCVSVTPTGVPGNGDVSEFCLTPNGQKFAFASGSSDLVANDTNGKFDLFLRDVATGVTTRVSVNPGGIELDDHSLEPSLSDDGLLLAFTSGASNLHHDVPVSSDQAYLRDLVTGEVWLASRGVDGQRCNAPVSSVVLVTRGAGADLDPIVAFWSTSTNLPDDGQNDHDIFATRPWSGASQCLSVDSSGLDTINSGGALGTIGISPDGESFYFSTSFTGLVPNDNNARSDVFRRTLQWTVPVEFGTGLAGTGGFVPQLFGIGGSCEDGRWSIGIEEGLGQTFGHLWVGFGGTNGLPLFGGSFYLDFAQPLFPIPIALDGIAGVGGTGALALDGVNVENLGAFSIFLQCTLVDGRAPKGVSISNALEIAIDG